MRNLKRGRLQRCRDNSPEVRAFFGPADEACFGMFHLPSPVQSRWKLKVIASNDTVLGWDHVSVSLPNSCPTWVEMEHVKREFFEDHEAAMQLHVPVADHVNCHAYCLHLWRPHAMEIPRPPSWMVGPKLEKAG